MASLIQKRYQTEKKAVGMPLMHRRLTDEFSPENRAKTLYVGNLGRKVTEYEMIKLFQQHGEVVRSQFMYHRFGDQRGQPRGFAFVELGTKEVCDLPFGI
jgi:RNA recognition motif-containing protein